MERRRRVPVLPAGAGHCWEKEQVGQLGRQQAVQSRHAGRRRSCKLEGFTYAPSDSLYWQHGHSSERDFIYVTTQNLNHDQLQALSDEVGGRPIAACPLLRLPRQTGPVFAKKLRRGHSRYPSLTIKRSPQRCPAAVRVGHDDYSLQVENLPKAPPKAGQQELEL